MFIYIISSIDFSRASRRKRSDALRKREARSRKRKGVIDPGGHIHTHVSSNYNREAPSYTIIDHMP